MHLKGPGRRCSDCLYKLNLQTKTLGDGCGLFVFEKKQLNAHARGGEAKAGSDSIVC
jgi:hypothetical protein